jgi:hypothetical protein
LNHLFDLGVDEVRFEELDEALRFGQFCPSSGKLVEPRGGGSHLGIEGPLAVNGVKKVEADRVEIVLGYPLKP